MKKHAVRRRITLPEGCPYTAIDVPGDRGGPAYLRREETWDVEWSETEEWWADPNYSEAPHARMTRPFADGLTLVTTIWYDGQVDETVLDEAGDEVSHKTVFKPVTQHLKGARRGEALCGATDGETQPYIVEQTCPDCRREYRRRQAQREIEEAQERVRALT